MLANFFFSNTDIDYVRFQVDPNTEQYRSGMQWNEKYLQMKIATTKLERKSPSLMRYYCAYALKEKKKAFEN